MDWILLLIGLSLIATLTAYLLGIIPYPIGWIVLMVVFALRIMQIRNKKHKISKPKHGVDQ